MKFYAVKNGRKKGVYKTLPECMEQVKDYDDAIWCKFKNEENATAFANQKINKEHFENYAYVDGSYNPETNVYGYGGFLSIDGKEYILQGSDNNEGMASMRNVAGEIQGAMAAVDKAIRFGLDKLTIYYDYKGIECWAKLTWKANNPYTKDYQDYMMSSSFILDIEFVHVKGHSGIEGNERADRLAKEAVGL